MPSTTEHVETIVAATQRLIEVTRSLQLYRRLNYASGPHYDYLEATARELSEITDETTTALYKLISK